MYTKDHIFNFAIAVHSKKNIINSSKIFFIVIITFILSLDEDNSTFLVMEIFTFLNISLNLLIKSSPAFLFS